MKKLSKMLLICYVGIFILGVIFLVLKDYEYSQKTDAYINRAQISGDREDMLEYLEILMTNLKNLGADQGHTAVIFKKADNDLSLHFKTLQRLHERLESIGDIPKSETAYQVALDDIRGTIREYPNPADGLVWVTYWWLYWLLGLMCLGIFVAPIIF